MAVKCNTGPGWNYGPCGPAPCTGECTADVDYEPPGAHIKACGCYTTGEPGAWDIHDAWEVNG